MCHKKSNYFTTFLTRFVLYQLSKNLNPPFFLEILSEISLKFSLEEAEDSEDESGLAGENIMSMLLKPSYTAQESEKVNSENLKTQSFFCPSAGL